MAELYEEQEVLVIRDNPSKTRAGAGSRLRLSRWRVDGRLGAVKLEKRSYFQGNDGKERMASKAEGLMLEDFGAIKAMWPEILAAFRTPPPFVATRQFTKQDAQEA